MTEISRKPYVTSLPCSHQGKVRDTHREIETSGARLMVATDAVSTHNVAHKSMVPDKGYLLTAMTIFWILEVLEDIPHQILAYGKDIYNHLPPGLSYPDDLHLRALVIMDLDMIDREFIWRQYMAGSLFSKFYSKGKPNPYGLVLPDGLQMMSRFSTPIFTPTEKSETDDPVESKFVEDAYPDAVELTRVLYDQGYRHALERGIDIIDSKAEAGYDSRGVLRIADEWLNGDCCRFVRRGDIQEGVEPPWMDKEIFRQAAKRMWGNGPKVPLEFPEEVLRAGSRAYHEVFEILTKQTYTEFRKNVLD